MKGTRIIVHSLEHARAAVAAAAEAGEPVILMSAPGAAAYLGAAVFREIIDAAAREFPDVGVTALLDCGSDAGLALNALRHGLKAVRLDAPEPVLARVVDMAGQTGAAVESGPSAPAVDLLDAADAGASCRAWLGRTPAA